MITDTRDKILDYVRRNKQARVHDLVNYLNLSHTAVHKQVKKLLLAGLLQRIGTPPRVFYTLSENSLPSQVALPVRLSKLPAFMKPYFWDVKFSEIDPVKDKYFIVKRAIDRGGTKAVKFVIKNYGLDAIAHVVLTTRDLYPITGNFWADMLDLDKNKVPCLQKPYSPIRYGPSR